MAVSLHSSPFIQPIMFFISMESQDALCAIFLYRMKFLSNNSHRMITLSIADCIGGSFSILRYPRHIFSLDLFIVPKLIQCEALREKIRPTFPLKHTLTPKWNANVFFRQIKWQSFHGVPHIISWCTLLPRPSG